MRKDREHDGKKRKREARAGGLAKKIKKTVVAAIAEHKRGKTQETAPANENGGNRNNPNLTRQPQNGNGN